MLSLLNATKNGQASPADRQVGWQQQELSVQTVEFKHAVGSQVVIKVSGLSGLVRGNYIGQYGQKETLVEYADTTGVIHKGYITEDEVFGQ